jgi:hypothetical protein
MPPIGECQEMQLADFASRIWRSLWKILTAVPAPNKARICLHLSRTGTHHFPKRGLLTWAKGNH